MEVNPTVLELAEEPTDLSEKLCCATTTAKVGPGMDVITDLSTFPSEEGDTATDGGNLPP